MSRSCDQRRFRPIQPALRWTSESLSRADGRGVVPVVSAETGGAPRPVASTSGDGPFHFTHRMSLFCADVCRRVDAFRHIDPEQVLVTFLRCRSSRPWGLQARLVPLRFRGGRLYEVRGRCRYKVQQIFVGRTEMKYVLSFYLPRFLDQTFDEKLVTVFHELYHIGEAFDGDIRRWPGDDVVHGGSLRRYDRLMAELARGYLRTRPPRAAFDFLRFRFDQLERCFGEVVGLQIPTPKLIPVERVG